MNLTRLELIEQAEYAILYAYWLHGVTRSKAIELLQISPEDFEQRISEFVDELDDDVLKVEELLRPSESPAPIPFTARDIRPDYYKQCGEVGRTVLRGWLSDEQLSTECKFVARQLGNDGDLLLALKYLWRAGNKPGESVRKDLEKARGCLREYLQFGAKQEQRQSLWVLLNRIEALLEQ